MVLSVMSADRFWSKVERRGDGECWLWTAGKTAQGYGSLRIRPHHHLAHRYAYANLVGPIPDGMTIEHDCHTRDKTCAGGDMCPHRACVNPAHLKVVTLAENIRLSGRHGAAEANAAKTTCVNGHSLTDPANLMSSANRRTCKRCAKVRRQAHRARAKEVV
jgi:hypothetical protein